MYSNTKDKNLSELLQVIKKGIEKCTLASKPITITTNIRDKFNEKHWYQISVSPIYNSLSEIIRFIAIGSDITQIKLAEMEIKIQHFEIEQQHKQIIAQNVEITDSILYSQRIQRSIMPPLSDFKSIFENSFIFYQPKNIVSGDFYWVAEKRNEKIIVVGDCTGHGVPGAFMSMLGIVLLNEIVNKHQDLGYNFRLNSSQVLDSLRIKLKKTLHQKGISGEANDGMDIAICIFNLKEQKIQFSGANQSLHIVRNNQMLKINGDRMPIGVYTENDQNFTKTDVKVYENDVFYLATDGYSDQFGGSGDKKFLTKNFKEMLISIHELPFDEQKQILSDIYEGWRGEQEQTDDILVLGFKV